MNQKHKQHTTKSNSSSINNSRGDNKDPSSALTSHHSKVPLHQPADPRVLLLQEGAAVFTSIDLAKREVITKERLWQGVRSSALLSQVRTDKTDSLCLIV